MTSNLISPSSNQPAANRPEVAPKSTATAPRMAGVLLQKPVQGDFDFCQAIVGGHVAAVIVLRDVVAVDAVLQVRREHQYAELVKGCTQRRNLGENIDTVAPLIHHLLDTATCPAILARRFLASWLTESFIFLIYSVTRIIVTGLTGAPTVKSAKCQKEPSAYTTRCRFRLSPSKRLSRATFASTRAGRRFIPTPTSVIFGRFSPPI